jgi:hypothetical protein
MAVSGTAGDMALMMLCIPPPTHSDSARLSITIPRISDEDGHGKGMPHTLDCLVGVLAWWMADLYQVKALHHSRVFPRRP